MKYPIGVQDFPSMRKEGFVYVDKTDLIYQLSQKKQVFLSRPRRFGKSLVLSTLKEYFSGHKELFEGLKINEYEYEWKQYPVIYIDFNGGHYKTSDGLQKHLNGFWGAMETRYGYVLDSTKDLTVNMLLLLSQIHQQTGEQVVVLIDEYDKPLMDVLHDTQYSTNHSFLREFYSAFKSAGKDLKFLMLTGVTRIAKLNIFSGLNQLQDISFNPQFEGLCGITEEELHSVFAEPIALLAKEYHYTPDVMKDTLKRMYDGYHFSKNFTSIYNPFSLINAFDSLQINNYWISSANSQWLVDMMSKSQFDIASATRKSYTEDQLQTYNGNPDEVIALVYQSGYLTISGIKYRPSGTTLYRLGIPNGEVRESFYPLLADRYFGKPLYSTSSFIDQVNEYLEDNDIDGLLGLFKSFFASIAYDVNNQSRDFEAHYQYTMWLIILLATGVDCRLEEKTNTGRIDMVLQNDTHIYLFEFKLDQSAKVARAQIDEKRYADKYDFTGKEIVKVGVNFSSKTRTIDDWTTNDTPPLLYEEGYCDQDDVKDVDKSRP